MQNCLLNLIEGYICNQEPQGQKRQESKQEHWKILFSFPLKTKINSKWQVVEEEQNECNTFQVRVARASKIFYFKS